MCETFNFLKRLSWKSYFRCVNNGTVDKKVKSVQLGYIKKSHFAKLVFFKLTEWIIFWFLSTAITSSSLRRVNVAAVENTTLHQRFHAPAHLTVTATFLPVLRQPKKKQFFCSVSNDLILKKESFFMRHDCGARSNSFY